MPHLVLDVNGGPGLQQDLHGARVTLALANIRAVLSNYTGERVVSGGREGEELWVFPATIAHTTAVSTWHTPTHAPS